MSDKRHDQGGSLGRVLLDLGWIVEADIGRALAIQGPGKRIGDILVAQGTATRERVEQAAIRPRGVGERLGELLVARGLITRGQLGKALVFQARVRRRLGEILVALAAVTREQLDAALQIQYRRRHPAAVPGLAAAPG